MRKALLPSLMLGAFATGCSSSLTGLGGTSGYACRAPQGVACDSVSGTYANSVAHRLPGQRPAVQENVPPAHAEPPAPTPSAFPSTSPPSRSTAIRSEPRVLRLWIKPWEDADGDLVDQTHVYVQIDNGHWLTEHVHRRTREAFAAVKPPPKPGSVKEANDGMSRPLPTSPAPRAGTFPGASPAQQDD